MPIIILFIIILIGIIGAVSFLWMNNGIESESGLKAEDFEIMKTD